MSKKTYHDALRLQRRALLDKFTLLRHRFEHSDDADRFRIDQQHRMLGQESRRVDQRLRELELEGEGIWEELRVNFRWMADAMVDGLEQWSAELDARAETRLRESHRED